MQGDGLTACVGADQFAERGALHGKVAGHQVVQQHPEAVDVASDRRLGAGQDLRRQIQGCAHDSPARARLGQSLARTEVHENQPSALLAHDVLRFDVSMDQTRIVNGSQRPTELVPDESSLAGAERPVVDQHLLERQTANKLHAKTDLIFMFFGPVHLDDVGMFHTSQRSPFVQ